MFTRSTVDLAQSGRLCQYKPDDLAGFHLIEPANFTLPMRIAGHLNFLLLGRRCGR